LFTSGSTRKNFTGSTRKSRVKELSATLPHLRRNVKMQIKVPGSTGTKNKPLENVENPYSTRKKFTG
jgi:hypothetical protein